MRGSRGIPALAAGALLCFAPLARAQPTFAGAAASVNGVEISNEILQHSFDEYLRDKQINMGAMRDPERVKRMQREALDLLIDQEVVWQAAKAAGVLAAPEEVDRAVGEIRAQFKSDEELNSRLSTEGYTPESYREHMKHLVSARKYLDRSAEQVKVSDADV